jgi:hypothetical protein
MCEQTVIYTYHEILLSNKKEWTIDTRNNLDDYPENYAEWKKPGWEYSLVVGTFA